MQHKTYTIQTKEISEIYIEENLLEKIDTILSIGDYSAFFVISDETAYKLCGSTLEKGLKKLGKPTQVHTLPTGEENKNTTSLFRMLKHLVEYGFDRKTAVIALGGGVTGDIATTVASLYHRGVDCIQIPTTLLSQTDAAIGGKGAVNIGEYKNSIGVIRQPRFVIIDPTLLKTLPNKQIRSGMGEVIKYGIAMDKELFDMLEKKQKEISPHFSEIISRCIDAKMRIVEKDPYEHRGDRQLLNFGHTLGHAIELYLHLTHGEAISIGMSFAIRVSEKVLHLRSQEADLAIALLKAYNLPTTLSKNTISKDVIYQHMKKDKKAVDGIPTFVLLETIGKVKSACAVSKEIIDKTLDEILI